MSSPPTDSWLKEENDRDFRKISMWIESVDENKPLGKLVKVYAEQKKRDGWWNGFVAGLTVGLVSGAVLFKMISKK